MNADRSGGAGITGTEQVISGPGGSWQAMMTFELHREEVLPWRAFLAALRGRYGTFLIGPADLTGGLLPQLGDPGLEQLGVADTVQAIAPFAAGDAGASLAADAALRASIIAVRLREGRRPPLGAYIGIGQRLHAITSVAPTSATDANCTIEPPLRSAATAGTSVNFTSPACTMRLAKPLAPDALNIPAQTMTTTLQMSIFEAF